MISVVFDPQYADHVTGRGHPERAARLEAFIGGLEAAGLRRAAFIAPTAATTGAIERVHPAAYVDLARRASAALPSGTLGELPTGDTIIGAESYDIALLAAGGAMRAADIARLGAPALAIVRPPGHHAEPARGMGFCVFNNIAVAAEAARKDIGPVLIADFDYHHGNGTQAWADAALESGRDGIGFLSTHAYPAYPGTGAFGESHVRDGGFVIDIPLPLSTSTGDFVAVWSTLLPLAARKLRPSIILVSAGFDFLAGDPIAGLPVDLSAVASLSALFGQVSADVKAPLAFILEGGYSLDNLRASGESFARTFENGDLLIPGATSPESERLRAMVTEASQWLT